MLGLGDLDSDQYSGDLMAETLSAGVRKVPDAAAARVEPMLPPSKAAVRAADRAFAALVSHSKSPLDPFHHHGNGKAESADRKDHHPVFADAEQPLRDSVEEVFSVLDDWLLRD
jgi:hypothetical protein